MPKSDQHASIVQRSLVYGLSLLLIWQPMLVAAAEAVSPTHSTNGRPTLDQAANGVPIVNIQNPNGQGVSQNFYNDLNVSSQGLILNNSRQLTQTQLGGYIEGNPNLTNGSASVILNEVIGTNPSSLKGYMEVGGARADVIVANPNGITCNGCGFINTSHATLTTGTAIMEGGRLQGFDVQGGNILIGENGLNASNTDRFDLIARSVRVTGQIHAKELNVVTGLQTVDRESLETSANSVGGEIPEFAIDSTALGGMYANRIRLIANEDGVGVRLDAPVAAQSGDMYLSANGKLSLSDASATGNMQIASTGDIDLNGRTVAGEQMLLQGNSLSVLSEQVSARQLAVAAEELQVSDGSALYATETLSLETETLTNLGEIAGTDVNVSVASALENQGDILADSTLLASADSISNAGTIRAGDGIAVTVEGNLANDGEIISGGDSALQSVSADIQNRGIITAETSLSVSANNITNSTGSILRSQDQLILAAQNTIQNSGNVVGKSLLDISAQGVTNLRNLDAVDGDGVLGSEQNLLIQSDTLQNRGGALIGSGGDMSLLIADELINETSSIQALGSIYIGADYPMVSEDMTPEEVEAALDLAKNNLVRNDQGEIVSMNGDITIFTRHLDNSREINVSKDYNVSAADLLEANWLALQDGDPSNDIIKLMAANAELTLDDWAFIFDPNVYQIPLYASSSSPRHASVNYWLTQYTNYLNNSLGAGLSTSQIEAIRKELVGVVTYVDNGPRAPSYYEYSGTSESTAINVGGAKNPLAETMWIIARVTQIIKDIAPAKYDAMLVRTKDRLANHMGTLNVWQSACGEGRFDWRGGGEACDNNYVKYYQFGNNRYDDVIDPDSDNSPSLISSGRNMSIYADVIDNRYSTLASVGDMRLEGDTLLNESFRLQRHFNVRSGWKSWHNFKHNPDPGWMPWEYTSYRDKSVDLLDENGNPTVINSVIAAGGSVIGSLKDSIENAELTRDDEGFEFDQDEYSLDETQDTGGEDTGGGAEPPEDYVDWGGSDIARVINTITSRTLELLDRHNSLFSINLDPNHPYLIETNPLFSSMDGFLGSSYLIDRLGLTPNVTTKRLGDSYYETQLIRDAIIAATGTRFLDPDFESDKEQFSWLMNNAVAAAEVLELSVGVSLMPDQVNALQHDIVWMEEKVVAGHSVLVPVLYLAPGSADLTREGSVISGNSIQLEAEGIGNSGVIAAAQDMTLIAGDKGVVNHQGALQAGGLLLVDSEGDIKNQSGTILGRDIALQSQGSIINEVDSALIEETRQGDKYWRTEYGEASNIEATGNVTLNAGEHIVVTGSRIAGENIGLQAAGNIQIESLAVREGFDGRHAAGEYQESEVRQLASTIEASMDVVATAGNSIGIIGSDISAGNNIALTALTGDILIRAAANESYENYHFEDSEEEKQITNSTVNQRQSAINAGGSLDIKASEGNLIAIASHLQSGGDMSLSAGGDIAFLAAQNSSYHLFENNKDGDYGAKSTKRDEIQSVTNVGTTLSAGGNLTIKSDGDQRYQAARLESGGDISIVSGGHITFEAVKDLYRESHESSQGDLSWNQMSSEGRTDETVLQSEIVAQGNLAIQAAEGLSIDLKDIDQGTVSEMIDGMVANNPDLAWLKEAEARGDVDWNRVQEIHDSWDESSQSMGVATTLIVSIVMAAVTAGAASAAIGSAAGASAGSGSLMAAASATGAAGVGNVAATAMAVSASTTLVTNTINNGGRVDAALKSMDNSETYQGLGVTGLTAGLTVGLDAMFNKYATFGREGAVNSDTINGLTKGFNLDTVSGMAGFTLHNAAQAGLNAGVSSTIYGTSFTDALNANLESQGNNVLSALAFNQVGNAADFLTEGAGIRKDTFTYGLFVEGGLGRTAMHSTVGGAITNITSGDFATGAAAAGLNQLLSTPLSGAANAIGGSQNVNAWRTAGAQLAGLAGAVAVDGNVNDGAWIAKQADAYNRQLHREELKLIKVSYKEYAEEYGLSEGEALKELTEQAMAMVDEEWNKELFIDPKSGERAEAWLNQLGAGQDIQSADGQATGQQYFSATHEQYKNQLLNLGQVTAADAAYNPFQYADGNVNNVLQAAAHDSSSLNSADAAYKLINQLYGGNHQAFVDDAKALVPTLMGQFQAAKDDLRAIQDANPGMSTEALMATQAYHDLKHLQQSLLYSANLLNNPALPQDDLELDDMRRGVNLYNTTIALGLGNGANRLPNIKVLNRLDDLLEARIVKPTESMPIGKLPSGYTRNADGSITGPRNGRYEPVGADDNGLLVYKDSGGSYYSLSGGVKVKVQNPAGQPDVNILQHREHHDTYVADISAQLQSQGYRVKNDVMFTSACSSDSCKPDIVFVRPGQELVGGIIEIKTGNATNSSGQSFIYPQVSSGDAVPSGALAQSLGLDAGVPLKDQGYPNGIPVYQITVPGL
ncbi:two-partner secretion domain-containing protein [Alcanivorax sediminis]|nr:DUF637 domain-containing protein [Alcanivorax sediminis]